MCSAHKQLWCYLQRSGNGCGNTAFTLVHSKEQDACITSDLQKAKLWNQIKLNKSLGDKKKPSNIKGRGGCVEKKKQKCN